MRLQTPHLFSIKFFALIMFVNSNMKNYLSRGSDFQFFRQHEPHNSRDPDSYQMYTIGFIASLLIFFNFTNSQTPCWEQNCPSIQLVSPIPVSIE
jgi:hypothetical protein